MKALADEHAAAELNNQDLPKDANRDDFMKIEEDENPHAILYQKDR